MTTFKIQAKSKGITTDLDIESDGIKVLVAYPGIKVDVLDTYTISSETTVKCMQDMSQQAWEHISTGELFQHLFNMLYDDDAYIPATIAEFLEEDKAAIHSAGLIVQMVEAIFTGKKEVFLRTPEDHMHPRQTQKLMSVILEIQKIPLGGL